VTGLLVAGAVESHTGHPLLRVVPAGAQLRLEDRVVGQVPDAPAPKWWGLYQAHLEQRRRMRARGVHEPVRWESPDVRRAREIALALGSWRYDPRWEWWA